MKQKKVIKHIFLILALYIFDFSFINAMSKEEAVYLCQVRLEKIEKKVPSLISESYRNIIHLAIKYVKDTISKLEKTSNPNEIYDLSTSCHDALFSIEWIVSLHEKTLTSFKDSSKINQQPNPIKSASVASLKDARIQEKQKKKRTKKKKSSRKQI